MRPMILAAFGIALGLGEVELSTDYTRERSLRVEISSHLESETTAFEMEVDGEPVEGDLVGGNQGSSTDRSIVYVDKVLAHDGGSPTRVRRSFEDVEFESESPWGSRSDSSPVDGITVEFSLDDAGDLTAQVVEGDEPEGVDLLVMPLELALDALLPEDSVEVGDGWELEKEVVRTLLGLELEQALFPRPERDGERESRGERGGGRRRGPGGGSGAGFLSDADWTGEATLAALEGDGDDRVAIVELLLSAQGDMPEPEAGGRDRRGIASGLSLVPENSYEVELEGRLVWHIGEARPVSLEIEGTYRTQTYRERESSRGFMTMESTVKGLIQRTVTITAEDDEE